MSDSWADFATDTSASDVADVNDHAGPATIVNSMGAGAGPSPTRALVVLWFICLALYWGLGYVFRRYR